jgi:hypothetical protein
MSLFDKYKAVPIAKLRKEIAKEDEMTKIGGSGTNLKIEAGRNKFRIFPPHNPELSNFYIMKGVHWVTNASDDGGDKETYRKSVLNAVLHSSSKVDLIDAYIDAAKRHLEISQDKKAQAKIKHIFGRDGLKRSTSYLCYAIKVHDSGERNFGLLEFKKTIRDKMNEEACMEDPDDPIVIDPFTDPLTGKAINILYNKDAKKATDYYTFKVLKEFPLTEEEMEIFDKSKPLSEMLRYSEKDWTSALEGLTIYDDENEIGLFEESWWIEEVKSIKSQMKFQGSKQEDSEEDEEKEVVIKETQKTQTKKQAVEEDEDDEIEAIKQDGDDLSGLSRDELKDIISDILEEDEEAVFSIKKSFSDNEIRRLIRVYRESKKEPVKAKKAPIEEDEDDEDESDKPKKLTIAQIRANLARGK